MNAKQKWLPFLLMALLSPAGAFAGQILQFNFNDTGDSSTSTGPDKATVNFYTGSQSSQTPVDTWFVQERFRRWGHRRHKSD